MAKQDGSTGNVTQQQWQALGFSVAADGTLYAPAVAPVAQESEALEFRMAARPSTPGQISCSCCWADPDEGEQCICDPDDACAACDDTDHACPCCAARAIEQEA